MQKTVSFNVDITGSVSGEKYTGLFEAKVTLSYADMFREDSLRRQFLGGDSTNASAGVYEIAACAAALGVGVIKSPEWFKQSVYCTEGAVGEDLNVLTEVYAAMKKKVSDVRDEIAKAAEAKRGALKEAGSDPK
jgi:hypothetical protein